MVQAKRLPKTTEGNANDGQLAITTLYLSEFVLKRLASIAKDGKTTPSELADQLLTEFLTPYED